MVTRRPTAVEAPSAPGESDVAITDVSAIYVRLPGYDVERTDSSRDAMLIRIDTDAGVTGWGEVDSAPLAVKAAIEMEAAHPLARGLRELLLGRDPFDTNGLWRDMSYGTLYGGRSGVLVHAMAGVDLALWDIKGKLVGQPVHRLLGGGERRAIRAYASELFQATPAATAERARAAADQGFTALKLGWEPFGADAALDEALVGAAREAIGPDVDLAVDAGLAWDVKTAIRRARMLAGYDLMWLEEPLACDDVRGYGRLSAAVDLPIAAGEEECTRVAYARLMDEGLIDVVQIDVTRTGLTQAMLIAADAAERGLPVANHNFNSDVNAAASLQFLAAAPNALICEYCVTPNELRRTLVRNPVRFEDGLALVPLEPGLGVEVDLDVVERFAYVG